MRFGSTLRATAALSLLAVPALAQRGGRGADTTPDPVKQMVARLNLESYKATVKGLTDFGDRRQGTARNRAAVDWIEAKLKSYGCSTERIKYEYWGRQLQNDSTRKVDSAAGRGRGGARGAGGRGRGAGGDTTGGRGAGGDSTAGRGGRGARAGGTAQGGGIYRGVVTRTGVNTDPMRQPDTAIRRIDSERDTPGEREEVVCTKVGTTHPEEMYIVGGHMDGHGFGQAANDDGSGAALVMELARVFSSPDIVTDRTIRFCLWNNEETGTNGARAYIEQRYALQGKENPPGSGKYPEPKWLGMIQHDMMMFDHGMPRPDGTMSPEQRPEADVNIEFAITSKFTEGAQKLAWFWHSANEKYATDYPATVSPHMTNTDSGPFQDSIPAISLRENERGKEIGAGWDPQWHQPTDVFTTYSDKDFRLGLNAAQTTFGAVALLTGAKFKKP